MKAGKNFDPAGNMWDNSQPFPPPRKPATSVKSQTNRRCFFACPLLVKSLLTWGAKQRSGTYKLPQKRRKKRLRWNKSLLFFLSSSPDLFPIKSETPPSLSWETTIMPPLLVCSTFSATLRYHTPRSGGGGELI